MPNFYFRATDADGKWTSGEIPGDSAVDAEARLQALGLTLESLSEADADPDHSLGSLVVTRRELAELVEQLSSLTRSGLTMPEGLRAAGDEATSPRLRKTFRELAGLVEAGEPLDSALLKAGRRFPPDLRGLIAAGARTGRLPEILGQYVEASNLGSDLRRMFAGRLTYPALMMVFVLSLVGFVCSIAQKAAEILVGTSRDFGVDQSSLSTALTAMARAVTEYGLQFLAVVGAMATVVLLVVRFGMGPARRRRWLCGLPVVGKVLRYVSLTEFCHRLAMLLEAETPLPLAFELASASVRDADVAEACTRMGRAVEAGEPLSTAMSRWDSIPAGLAQLFRWSEDRRNLPEALHLAGAMFEARARSQASYASHVISALMLLLILWWVGFAVSALCLPMLSLINVISKLSG